MNTRTIPQRFDNALDAIQSMIMSFLVKLGPFFVALMPSLFTAYAIYYTFESEAGTVLALVFAITVGLAMETVGIVATHTAIDLYNAKEEKIIQSVKFSLMVWLVPVYVIGVSSVVYFSQDAFTPLVKGLGVASPFLTCIVYIAVALARDVKQTEAKQDKAEDRKDSTEDSERQWQREKEFLELRLRHEEKLAKIEAKAVNPTVNPTVQNGQNSVKIDVFDSVNMSKDEKKKRLLDSMIDIYLDDPKAGVSTVANSLNVSRQTIYNYQSELEQSGQIHRNGDGIEVTE